jgi:hypothetical protein
LAKPDSAGTGGKEGKEEFEHATDEGDKMR